MKGLGSLNCKKPEERLHRCYLSLYISSRDYLGVRIYWENKRWITI